MGLVTLTNRMPEIMLKLASDEFRTVVLTEAAAPIAEMAQARAPVGATGDLKDSIEVKPFMGEGVGIFMAWYGIFAEHGFHDRAGNAVPPRPFLVPAAEAGKLTASAIVAAWLRRL